LPQPAVSCPSKICIRLEELDLDYTLHHITIFPWAGYLEQRGFVPADFSAVTKP
jgi:hypothetical protein